MLRHTLRVLLGIALFLYFVVVLAVLGLRYVVLPRVDSFRPQIEAAVSDKIHAQFRIGKIAPHWTGFQPGLEVTDVTITNRDGKEQFGPLDFRADFRPTRLAAIRRPPSKSVQSRRMNPRRKSARPFSSCCWKLNKVPSATTLGANWARAIRPPCPAISTVR